jgi:hypothetical protein
VRLLAVTGAGLALVAALVATGSGYGVDRERYLEANAALLAELPMYPGAQLVSTRALPYYAGDSSWSPVAGYTTLTFFRLPPETDPRRVAAFYERRACR